MSNMMEKYATLVSVPLIHKPLKKSEEISKIPFIPLRDTRKLLTTEQEAGIKQLLVVHNIDEYKRKDKDTRLTPLVYVAMDAFTFTTKEVLECQISV